MKSTIKRNLLIGFGLSLLLLIISSVVSYNSIQNLLSSSRAVNHTDSVIQHLETIISTVKDAETGQRGYLLTGREGFLEPYNGSHSKAVTYLNEVRIMTADNMLQQQSAERLGQIITSRLEMLDRLIRQKRAGQSIDMEELEEGRKYMMEARAIVQLMENREHILLEARNAGMRKYAEYTPIVIMVAAILSVLITIAFFAKVNADVDKRAELQRSLEEKDAEISLRINLIQGIADKIATGDYKIRLNDNEKDGLGSLSGSLNKMAASLESSFKLLSDKEWLQAGIAELNTKMLAERTVQALTEIIIRFMAEYSNSQMGAFYLLDNHQTLCMHSSYAISRTGDDTTLKVGEGIAGQVAQTGQPILVKDILPGAINLNYAAGQLKPQQIIALPVYHEHKVVGVIELGSVGAYGKNEQNFLHTAATMVGIVIDSAQSRKKLQELLEETQAQSEELQVQQSELEGLNTQLETQTESLQASEEELRVQQEELQQANEELEERTRMLEEKNQLIVERNLDIQKKAEELALSTRYKSEFLANMSHELRTPLNSILLLSRLLSENNDKNLNSDEVESARVIQSSGNGLLSLIDEILDLSKIESGKMDIEFASITVHDIANDMRSLFAPIAREKGLELKIEIDQRVPPVIETDRMRLEQIVKNLLSNALKFTTRGSVVLSVSVSGSSGQSVSFSVRDTGIGIPKEKHALIFEAFQQADGSTKRKYGGTGLGLSISRELSKLLGGEITLTSESGAGSEFTVTVPVSRDAAVPAIDPAERVPAALSLVPMAQSVEPKRKDYTVPLIPAEIADDRDNVQKGDNVVLIIEDDTNFARSLLSFTRKRGYKGVVVVRGDQASAFAEQYHPVAILLDIQLPMKDGWQVMDELKADVRTRHIPVHMMSSINARRESLQSGAVDFINKPVALEQMQQMFHKLEDALNRYPKKVLIVEENPRHAQALAYFLESFNMNAEIQSDVNSSIEALNKKEIDCVILDMGVPDQKAYETLDLVKKSPGLEHLPIIVFTGKELSRSEESRIKQYADSIVLKTAHSYQRILDEVGLFLHLVEENNNPAPVAGRYKKLGALDEVLKGKKVLVADDDVRNIFSLTRSLERHGMQVISATDGREALTVLAANTDTDVVLMDIMMPEMDGYESIKKIRQMPKYKKLPILAVTAKAMMGDREKCIAVGASDYISKPVDVDQLLSLLRVWLYSNGTDK